MLENILNRSIFSLQRFSLLNKHSTWSRNNFVEAESHLLIDSEIDGYVESHHDYTSYDTIHR